MCAIRVRVRTSLAPPDVCTIPRQCRVRLVLSIRRAAATTRQTTIDTPEGEELPCISISTFITRPVGYRPTVVVVDTVKVWCGPNHTVSAPLMLLVGLQHGAVRAAFNWFEEFTYCAHSYNYRHCVGWDRFALLGPEGVACFRGASNVCKKRNPSVRGEWLELDGVGHGDCCDVIHARCGQQRTSA